MKGLVPLYFLSSTQWMDEDNIGRDVEEQERKRVVINNAIVIMLKFSQLRCKSYEALRITVIHPISLH